eukprot:g4831.t1
MHKSAPKRSRLTSPSRFPVLVEDDDGGHGAVVKNYRVALLDRQLASARFYNAEDVRRWLMEETQPMFEDHRAEQPKLSKNDLAAALLGDPRANLRDKLIELNLPEKAVEKLSRVLFVYTNGLYSAFESVVETATAGYVRPGSRERQSATSKKQVQAAEKHEMPGTSARTSLSPASAPGPKADNHESEDHVDTDADATHNCGPRSNVDAARDAFEDTAKHSMGQHLLSLLWRVYLAALDCTVGGYDLGPELTYFDRNFGKIVDEFCATAANAVDDSLGPEERRRKRNEILERVRDPDAMVGTGAARQSNVKVPLSAFLKTDETARLAEFADRSVKAIDKLEADIRKLEDTIYDLEHKPYALELKALTAATAKLEKKLHKTEKELAYQKDVVNERQRREHEDLLTLFGRISADLEKERNLNSQLIVTVDAMEDTSTVLYAPSRGGGHHHHKSGKHHGTNRNNVSGGRNKGARRSFNSVASLDQNSRRGSGNGVPSGSLREPTDFFTQHALAKQASTSSITSGTGAREYKHPVMTAPRRLSTAGLASISSMSQLNSAANSFSRLGSVLSEQQSDYGGNNDDQMTERTSFSSLGGTSFGGQSSVRNTFNNKGPRTFQSVESDDDVGVPLRPQRVSQLLQNYQNQQALLSQLHSPQAGASTSPISGGAAATASSSLRLMAAMGIGSASGTLPSMQGPIPNAINLNSPPSPFVSPRGLDINHVSGHQRGSFGGAIAEEAEDASVDELDQAPAAGSDVPLEQDPAPPPASEEPDKIVPRKSRVYGASPVLAEGEQGAQKAGQVAASVDRAVVEQDDRAASEVDVFEQVERLEREHREWLVKENDWNSERRFFQRKLLQASTELSTANEDVAFYRKTVEELRVKLKDAEEVRLKKAKEKLEAEAEKLADKECEAAALKLELQQIKRVGYGYAEDGRVVDRRNEQDLALAVEMKKYRERAEDLLVQLKKTESSLAERGVENLELKEQREKLTEDLKDVLAEHKELQRGSSELESREKSLRDFHAAVLTERDGLKTELTELRAEHERVAKELKLLQTVDLKSEQEQNEALRVRLTEETHVNSQLRSEMQEKELTIDEQKAALAAYEKANLLIADLRDVDRMQVVEAELRKFTGEVIPRLEAEKRALLREKFTLTEEVGRGKQVIAKMNEVGRARGEAWEEFQNSLEIGRTQVLEVQNELREAHLFLQEERREKGLLRGEFEEEKKELRKQHRHAEECLRMRVEDLRSELMFSGRIEYVRILEETIERQELQLTETSDTLFKLEKTHADTSAKLSDVHTAADLATAKLKSATDHNFSLAHQLKVAKTEVLDLRTHYDRSRLCGEDVRVRFRRLQETFEATEEKVGVYLAREQARSDVGVTADSDVIAFGKKRKWASVAQQTDWSLQLENASRGMGTWKQPEATPPHAEGVGGASPAQPSRWRKVRAITKNEEPRPPLEAVHCKAVSETTWVWAPQDSARSSRKA